MTAYTFLSDLRIIRKLPGTLLLPALLAACALFPQAGAARESVATDSRTAAEVRTVSAESQGNPGTQIMQEQRRTERTTVIVTLPRGFDSVDPRFTAPRGFAQNNSGNTIQSIREHCQDGDYVLLEGQVTAVHKDNTFTFTDKNSDSITMYVSAQTRMEPGMQLCANCGYQIWARVHQSFLHKELDVLLIGPLH